MTSKNPDIVIALQQPQELDSNHPEKLDALLSSKLSEQSRKKGRLNAMAAGLFIASLVEGSPSKSQEENGDVDNKMSQYHAELMKRFETQYTKLFPNR